MNKWKERLIDDQVNTLLNSKETFALSGADLREFIAGGTKQFVFHQGKFKKIVQINERRQEFSFEVKPGGMIDSRPIKDITRKGQPHNGMPTWVITS